MFTGIGQWGQGLDGFLSRTGALWILIALAGCATEADFQSEAQSVETAAWEGAQETTQPPQDSRAGITTAVEIEDVTGVDSQDSFSAGLLSGTSSTPSSSSSGPTHTGSCSVPGALSTGLNSGSSGSLSGSDSDSTLNSSTGVGGTDSSSTSAVDSSTTSPSTTTTEPDDTSSAGATELCGRLPFDAAWLRQKLAEFTGAVPTSLLGAPARIGERSSIVGRADARAWLAEQYSRLGYRLDGHDYPGGTNVFAERRGTGDGVIIISSHYDTVAGSVGADDDGSGVVVGLAVAAALARCQPEKTVRIIAFDQEENGMLGSRAYVRSLRDAGQAQDVAGVIQIEMAGYDRNNDGFINRVDCGHTNNRFMVDALSATISNERLDLTAIGECKGRSDHVSFWDANIPAITVSEHFFGDRADRNPCYHLGCDTVNNLNFDFMNKIARAVTLTTIALAGAK